MNLAYFRKSTHSVNETIENVKKKAEEDGWKILGEANIPDNKGKMVLVCRPEWVKTIVEADYNLLGFLPCAITVFQKGDDVLVGTGQPTVIKALAQSQDIAELAAKADSLIKDLIHEAAGVEALKAKSVKLYSTQTCPYCKMEKAWLDEKKIKHDLVYVDMDQQEAQKMVEKTGQMGVPVTEVTFEEGEPEYIVGFDKPRLAELLGISA